MDFEYFSIQVADNKERSPTHAQLTKKRPAQNFEYDFLQNQQLIDCDPLIIA